MPSKTELLNYCKIKGMPGNKTFNLLGKMEKENYFIFIDEKNKRLLKLNEE